MFTKRKPKTGWGSQPPEDAPARYSFTGVIQAIIQVVPGGVIRAGKTAYTDDTNTGFWLGVDTDGLAKLNLGGSAFYLKWTGTQLQIAGSITGPVSIEGGEIRWADSKGVLAYGGLSYTESANDYVKVQTAAAALLDLRSEARTYGLAAVNANTGADAYAIYAETSSRGAAIQAVVSGIPAVDDVAAVYGQAALNLVGHTSYGIHGQARYQGAGVRAEATGGAFALQIAGGQVDGGSQRYTALANAAADTDALNRQTGDGRYLSQTAGWTGTFTTGDGRTATVTNGQITAVA